MTHPPRTGEKPGFWGSIKAHIIHPELTEQQVAWSFAIGFSVAWNPLLGLHIAMVMLFCAIFRGLHRPLMLAASFINNPWTLVPIATTSAYVGNLLRGRGLVLNMAKVHWKEIGLRSFVTWDGFQAMTVMLQPILKSYLVGGTVLCVLALPVGYYAMLTLARRLRRMHLHNPFHPHPPSDGGPHGHALPDAPGPADAGQAPRSPAEP